MSHQVITASNSTPKGPNIGQWIFHALLASVLMAGCANGAQVPVTQSSHPGELLFNGHTKPDVDCYSCHNGDGSGAGSGPDLSEAMAEHSDAELSAIINDGPSFMPSFEDKLTAEESSQIIAWLRIRFPTER